MRTLVLNAGYEPLAVVSFKRAIVLVLDGKASIVASDDEHPVLSASGEWERPSVILLRRYVRIPNGRAVPVSRRGVLRRDGAALRLLRGLGLDDRPRHPALAWRRRQLGEPGRLLPALQQREGRPHAAGDGVVAAASSRAPPHGTAWLVRGVERALPQWEEFLAPAA